MTPNCSLFWCLLIHMVLLIHGNGGQVAIEFPDEPGHINNQRNNPTSGHGVPVSGHGVPVFDDDRIFFPREADEPDVSCFTYEDKHGSCRLLVQCATFYAEIAQLSRSPCAISEEQQGVCCPPTKRPTQDASNVVSKPQKKIVFAPDMKPKEIDEACFKSIKEVKVRESKEEGLIQNNIIAESGTPVFLHARLFETNQNILELGKKATLTLKATEEIAKRFALSKQQAESSLSNFGVESTIIKDACPRPTQCFKTRYRTMDGSCNNRQNPDWGKAGTAYERFLPPNYSNGIGIPRQSQFNNNLPSPRRVSTEVTIDRDSTYTNFTMLIMQWGQFLDHDMTHTPISKGHGNSDISCCSDGDIRPPQDLHPECMPISIPQTDPFYSRFNQRCMEFVRSMPAIRPKCKFGPREQMNQITAFIDGSNVYGSSLSTSRNLRELRGGLLKTSPSNLLPPHVNSPGCRARSAVQQCFLAGDSRVNEQPNLALMHTIWMRQHNRVAGILARVNPGWKNDDEILFQESRRIVVAQMQHITYNEYLPIVLGRAFMETYGLVPQRNGFANSYKEFVNPSIHNSFTAAAFRYGHTLVSSFLESFNKFGTPAGALELSKTQFVPFSLYQGFDNLVRGLTQQRSEKFDRLFTSQVTEKLFAQQNQFGMDLVALNIQRGRDHGLPSYPHWRDLCGLTPTNSWDDLHNIMPAVVVNKLRNVYEDVQDIDLFIGGILETPLPGSLLGSTFLCLVGDQFARLKIGDRFFYENQDQFSKAQLNEIRKTSLARVLCDNSDDVSMLQPLVFTTAHLANKRAVCNSDILIPKPNYSKWVNEPVWPEK